MRGRANTMNQEWREELVALIEELSNPSLQEKLWILHKDRPNSSGIDHVFHFLFDDTDLAKNPEAEIGNILLNKDEAGAVREVTCLLEKLLSHLGDVSSEQYISNSGWPSVVAAALRTQAVFKQSR